LILGTLDFGGEFVIRSKALSTKGLVVWWRVPLRVRCCPSFYSANLFFGESMGELGTLFVRGDKARLNNHSDKRVRHDGEIFFETTFF